MLLQASGRASAAPIFSVSPTRFLLSVLILQGCEEKRLLDAMLLALPR
jgi:hypothetical protein